MDTNNRHSERHRQHCEQDRELRHEKIQRIQYRKLKTWEGQGG